MDGPPIVPKFRRFLRWLSPLRFRFWLGTVPALFILTFSLLSCWPGLVYEWKINNEWYIARSTLKASDAENDIRNDVEIDSTILRIGPLKVDKSSFTWKYPPEIESRGFYTADRSETWTIGYQKKNGNTSFDFTVQVGKGWL